MELRQQQFRVYSELNSLSKSLGKSSENKSRVAEMAAQFCGKSLFIVTPRTHLGVAPTLSETIQSDNPHKCGEHDRATNL